MWWGVELYGKSAFYFQLLEHEPGCACLAPPFRRGSPPCAFCFYFTIFFGIFRGSIINDLKSALLISFPSVCSVVVSSAHRWGLCRSPGSQRAGTRLFLSSVYIPKNKKETGLGFLATVDWLLFLTFSLKWRERHNVRRCSRYLNNYTDICWNLWCSK